MLLLQRFLAGVACALVFVSGGVLAARLAQQHPHQSGWLLGLYYGGTGWGIVACALVVPWVMPQAADWPQAWWWLGALCVCALWPMALAARACAAPSDTRTPEQSHHDATLWPSQRKRMVWVLAGYGCFGMGYIGYKTRYTQVFASNIR